MVTKYKAVSPVDFTAITGVSPTLVTEGGYVNNLSATSMSNIILPSGQTDGRIVLMGANGNTTLLHGLGFLLKNSANVILPTNGIIRLIKYSVQSNSWIEESRSF